MSWRDPEPWEDFAPCKGVEDTDIFFPPYEPGEQRAAKDICFNLCPFRQECLALALTAPWRDVDGIWGGLTLHERQRLTVADGGGL